MSVERLLDSGKSNQPSRDSLSHSSQRGQLLLFATGVVGEGLATMALWVAVCSKHTCDSLEHSLPPGERLPATIRMC